MKEKKKKEHKSHKSRKNFSSSESDYEWTLPEDSKGGKLPIVPAEHSWMGDVSSVEGFIDSFTKARPQKEKVHTETQSKAVELNPYWNEGGSGVPSYASTSNSRTEKSALTKENEAWLYKSYKHCLEQSKGLNIPLKHFLLERWNDATVDHMLRKFGRQSSSNSNNRSRSPLSGEAENSGRPRWRKATAKQPVEEGHAQPTGQRISSGIPPSASTSETYPSVAERDTDQTRQFTQTEEREVTDADINEMAAKVLRAELASNTSKAEKLRMNLAKLRDAKQRGIKVRLRMTRKAVVNPLSGDSNEPTVIALSRINDKGAEMPVHIPNLIQGDYRAKKFNSLDSTGKRTAYFPEDTVPRDLNDLVREEHFRSATDMKYEFTRMAAKSGSNVDDEYADAFVSKRSHAERDAARSKQDAVAAYKRRTVAESSCTTCLERVPKHLVITVGEKVFLSLPEHISMVTGQCFITPYEHIGSITRVDDCTLGEIKAFKRQLVQMFQQRLNGSSCVFMETATKPDSAWSHAQIECIPISSDAMESVSGYFRKAIEEIGSEWDQNRRVIKLVKPGFGAYSAVPPKFPYFAVEFGLNGGGLARVLDDGRDIPAYFGREVIAELLEKDTRYWRKPKVERFEQLRAKVVQFENWWEPFNKWSLCDPRGVSACDTSELCNMPIPEGPELPPGLS